MVHKFIRALSTPHTPALKMVLMEEGGAKRIVILVAVVAVAAIGVFWYWQRARQRALGSGAVYVKNQPADQSSAPLAPPATPPSAETADSSQPSSSAPPQSSATTPSTPKPSAAVSSASRPAPPAHTAPPPMVQPRGALEVPASDTIPRNPPSGLIFAGAGKYQLYRQGDITWRLDTDTGRACIIFATDVQWSRNRVYDSGCGAS